MIKSYTSLKPKTIVYQGKTNKDHEIVIRYPMKTDSAEMLRYINTLSKEQTFILFQGEQLTIKEETAYLRSLLNKMKKGNAMMLLVFYHNQLIGESNVEMRDKATKHEGSFGISIAREFRNEGIGKILIQVTLDEAKKTLSNIRIMTLGCFANNPLAYELYKKFNFIEYGKLPKGILHKGTYIDHIFMYKQAQ
jgi:RimJ/RimL family protein N-acetyltransferase